MFDLLITLAILVAGLALVFGVAAIEGDQIVMAGAGGFVAVALYDL